MISYHYHTNYIFNLSELLKAKSLSLIFHHTRYHTEIDELQCSTECSGTSQILI